jgi:hypothetical protein
MTLIKILIDNSVRHHSVVYKGQWESGKNILWGNDIPIQTGQLISNFDPPKVKKDKNIQANYIATLINNESCFDWYTTDLLKFERFHQAAGKFTNGCNCGDHSVFQPQKNIIQLSSLDNFSFCLPQDNLKEKYKIYLEEQLRVNNEYKEIYDKLSSNNDKKHTQDAWHLYCVKRYKLDIFLTCDFKLKNKLSSLNCNLGKYLKKIVQTPESLCDEHNLKPLSLETKHKCFM